MEPAKQQRCCIPPHIRCYDYDSRLGQTPPARKTKVHLQWRGQKGGKVSDPITTCVDVLDQVRRRASDCLWFVGTLLHCGSDGAAPHSIGFLIGYFALH